MNEGDWTLYKITTNLHFNSMEMSNAIDIVVW